MPKAVIFGEYKLGRILPELRARGVTDVVVYSAVDFDGFDVEVKYLSLDWTATDVLKALAEEQADVAIANPYAHGQEQLPIAYGAARDRWGGHFLAHPAAFAEVACDKVVLHETAIARGWPVPDGVVCTDAGQVRAAVNRLGFPVVLKECQSQAGDGRFFVAHAADLDTVLADEPRLPVIVQRYQRGLECGVELISSGSSHVRWPIASLGRLDTGLDPSFRARAMPCALPERAAADLDRLIRDINENLVPFGPWQMDFAVVDGDLCLLEINARLGGLSDLGSVATGTDSHSVFAAAAMGGELPEVTQRLVAIELPSTQMPGNPLPAEPDGSSLMTVTARTPTNRCFINTDHMQVIVTVDDVEATKRWITELHSAGLLRCTTDSAFAELDKALGTFDGVLL